MRSSRKHALRAHVSELNKVIVGLHEEIISGSINIRNLKMQVHQLSPNNELRFHVGKEPIKLELRRGLAEIHGTEMMNTKTYTFNQNLSVAVFTYHGATFEMTGEPLKCHIGQKCDYMNFYLGIHSDLEKMRDEADKYYQEQLLKDPQNEQLDLDVSKIPICLVCKQGYTSSKVGKSTLCRILLNYAVRRGRTPVFVNLDPEKGLIGVPGTLGALSVESQIDIENGLALKLPMLMHYGHTTPEFESSTLLYKTLVENLASIVHSKLKRDRKSFCSGLIISACSWANDTTNEILLHACKSFSTNVVCVMDDEVLQDDLQKLLGKCPETPNLQVINAPKTVSIVARTPDSQGERYKSIREYFYGTPSEPYNPTTSEIKFSYLKRLIYTIGNPLMLPDSLMPIGLTSQNTSLKVVHYECKATDLLNMVLSVSHIKIDEIIEDPTVVLRSNIMGFICVTNVRREEDLVTILAPQRLPNPMNHVLLVSKVSYVD